MAAYAVALILFLFCFARPLWNWATWDSSRGTFELGIVKITSRPPFPSDARAIIAGLVLPVVLAAFGRIVSASERK